MSVSETNSLSELSNIDWDFSGERANGGTGGSHWYPARFVPQVPGILTGFLSTRGETVLDPFCGSGTTMVEARRLGRHSIGIDTNRVAVLISEARLAQVDPTEFGKRLEDLVQGVSETLLRDPPPIDEVPNYDESRHWYHPQTLTELAGIWSRIDASDSFGRIARGVFSGILRQSSSQDKHWGWICDNVRPRELVYKPALDFFRTRMRAHQRELDLADHSSRDEVRSEVVWGDCRLVLDELQSGSIDAVVTSPPYFGMTDYVRSQRLTYWWFDWPLDGDRSAETGARYKRHRKSAHSDYMEEMTGAFVEISRVLKKDGLCAIVAGESPDRQPYLDDLKLVLQHKCGFALETVLHRRVARQRALTSRSQGEEVIIVRNDG